MSRLSVSVSGFHGNAERAVDVESAQPDLRMSWFSASLLIVANMMGTGVLSLPYALSQLGWVPYFVLFAVFSTGAAISGITYSRLYENRKSDWVVIADAGFEAYGRMGSFFVQHVAYVYLGGCTIIYNVTAQDALAQTFKGYGIMPCDWLWGVVVAATVALVVQCRSSSSVPWWIAAIGVLTILGPCIAIVVYVLMTPPENPVPTELFAQDATMVHRGVAVMDIIFAFAGQIMFTEFLTDMNDSRQFPKSVGTSTALMAVSYSAVAAICYARMGPAAFADGAAVTSHIENDTLLRILNALLAVHVMIAEIIEVNVLTRGIAHSLGVDVSSGLKTTQADGVHSDRKSAPDSLPSFSKSTAAAGKSSGPASDANEGGGSLCRGAVAWLVISSLVCLGAFVISALVPFFSALMGLVSALAAVAQTYTIPLALAMKLLPMRPHTWWLCAVLVVVSILLAIAGTVASAADIVSQFSASPPFSC